VQLLPLLLLGLFGVYYLYMMRAQKALVAEHRDKTLRAVAERLGLTVIEGDPELNLYFFQQPVLDYRRRAVCEGRPYGRPTRLLLVDGQSTEEHLFSRTRTISFGCFLEVPCPAQIPPFEVSLRAPNEYLVPPVFLDDLQGLFEVSTGDPTLDATVRVVSHDPRVGPLLAPALRLLATQPYVHMAGASGTLTISYSRYALPYLAHSPEEQLLALETAACALTGRPAPAAPALGTSGASGMAGAPDDAGLPMPCTRCGAPMTLVSGPHLHSAFGLSCGFCGASEPLAADAAERARHLRFRLTQLQRARESDEAPLRTVAMLKRAWIPALVLLTVVFAIQIAQSIDTLTTIATAAPEALLSAAIPMGIPVALLSGYFAGYLGMSRGYARAALPLLRARPPRAAGLAVRCRSCGGDLPPAQTPEVKCGYCQATNLLDATLTARASELLQAEISAYQARARSVTQSDGFRAPVKAFYRWAAGGAAVGALVAGAAIAVLVVSMDDGPAPKKRAKPPAAAPVKSKKRR
jgi:hypothetical protein